MEVKGFLLTYAFGAGTEIMIHGEAFFLAGVMQQWNTNSGLPETMYSAIQPQTKETRWVLEGYLTDPAQEDYEVIQEADGVEIGEIVP